ncbi:NADH pyrophosphatase [Agyrium rufum]|nr:NADH pyrophosphatase [Agyrium rufum]
MPSMPELPEPAHPQVDSMLSRKFGKEVANYFSGSPLNRLSFLRSDNKFLSAAIKHPSTSFLLMKDLAPLAQSTTKLAYASFKEVEPLVGSDPYALTEEDQISAFNSSTKIPQLLFLGIDEQQKTNPASAAPQPFSWKIYSGTPFFAVDVTPTGSTSSAAEALIEKMTSPSSSPSSSEPLTFLEGRTHMNLDAPEAAIYAQARAMIDWNLRNPFCGGCGRPTLSINGGTKRTCPPTDLANSMDGAPVERPPCATRKGVSNLCFPRTDPVIIMAILHPKTQHILLGRSKRWPPHWYSTLAGFIEPGESIEEAVRREVWEESGVSLSRVVIHSSQPWPYPANLMIGAVGVAVEGQDKVLLEHDPELEDARWWSLEDVKEGLRVGTSGLGEGPGEDYKEGGLRLPPRTAIANQLLEAVCHQDFGGDLGMSKI